MSDAKKVTDHDEIRRWAEARGGEPAAVADTLENDREGGILRIRFRDEDESLQALFWEEFFEIFDRNRLAALLQDETESGGESRFVKFVSRD